PHMPAGEEIGQEMTAERVDGERTPESPPLTRSADRASGLVHRAPVVGAIERQRIGAGIRCRSCRCKMAEVLTREREVTANWVVMDGGIERERRKLPGAPMVLVAVAHDRV